MSKGKRDTYTSEFKFKVAIEAMSGDKQCQCGVRLSIQAGNIVLSLILLILCCACLAQNDEKEYEHLFKLWEKERMVALKEWKSSFSISSRGPNYATKSYNALVSKSAKLIPFLLKHLKRKGAFEEYRQYMDLFATVLKIRFEGKYIPEEDRILLTDYNIKFIPLLTLKDLGKENDFVYEYELWWDQGRSRTPEVFARKYQAYSEARKNGNTEDTARTFELLQNMGIIILPNILGKMEDWDETLFPMFVYLSCDKTLKTIADCRQWWEKNKGDYKIILDY